MSERPRLVMASTAVALLSLTSCGQSAPEVDAATSTGGASATAMPSPSASTSGTGAADATQSRSSTARATPSFEKPPDRRVDAGTVRQGTATVQRGSGDQTVHYEVGGEFAVIVELDCSRCTGTVLLTATKRSTPWFEGQGPSRVTALENIFARDTSSDLIVKATGDWTLRMRSWNDTPYQRGAQSGRDAAVVKLGDTGTKVKVTTRPQKGSSMLVRMYSARAAGQSADSYVIGGDSALDEVVEVRSPVVVAITGNGSWRLEPMR